MTPDRPKAARSEAIGPVMKRPILIYVITEDWYFWSHRLPLARAARDAGWDVVVATRVQDLGQAILEEGFRLIPLRLRRQSLSPWSELAAICELVRIYGRERPTLVHHVAMKPVVYGSLAARLAAVPAVVNALAGMGYVFTSRDLKARLLRPLVMAAFSALLDRPNSRLVLQNPEDVAAMTERRIVSPKRVALIRGSGVDTGRFTPSPEPSGTPVAIMVSRMLWDKGVGDLVEAARILKRRRVPIQIALVGSPDPDNPASVSMAQLQDWASAGHVAWWGERDDIAEIWRRSHIAVLPSYREGLPKSLLEAAASGRAMVATDVSGCREVVRDGLTGSLVPAGDPIRLADALEALARQPELRMRLGAAARRLVEQELSEDVVIGEMMAVYRQLMKACGT